MRLLTALVQSLLLGVTVYAFLRTLIEEREWWRETQARRVAMRARSAWKP